MSDRRPILHVVPGAPFGGAQRLAIDLAASQTASGLDARLLLLGEARSTSEAARAAGVAASETGDGPQKVLRARHAMRESSVIHLHLPPPWLATVLPVGPKAILHLHVRPAAQVHARGLRTTLDSWGTRAILHKTDHAIAISRWIEVAWREEFGGDLPRTSIVHNGIPPHPIVPESKGPFTLGTACRLSDRKGIEEFIELAAILHARDPQLQFRIAGDGPDRERFEDMARAAGLAQSLRFVGFVTDMAAFWANVHLAAFTPPFEPFGLRLIEPVGYGVPVIAYRNGSGSDEVIAECRGIAAEPYGDALALANLVMALRRDASRRRRMANEGREDVAERFSLAAMARGVEKAYCLAGWKAPARPLTDPSVQP